MKEFLGEDFLLQSAAARNLYHGYAEHEPILDYHCHMSPKDIAENRRFNNLFEIWLEGDHYKWRAMRANGVAERYCTGRRSAVREVHGVGAHRAAYAAQSAVSLDSPGAEALLRDRRPAGRNHAPSASGNEANAQLATDDLRAHGILKKFNVKALAPPTTRPTISATTGRLPPPDCLSACFPPSARTRRSTFICPSNSMPGSPSWPKRATSISAASRLFSMRIAAAPRVLPPDGRAALRSRPGALLRGFLPGDGSRGDLRPGSRRQGGRRRRTVRNLLPT